MKILKVAFTQHLWTIAERVDGPTDGDRREEGGELMQVLTICKEGHYQRGATERDSRAD